MNRSRVQVRNVDDGREILSLRGAPSRPFDGGFNPLIAWSPDGRRIAALNWDQSVSIWNGTEESIPEADRWAAARSRVFAWHLAEAEAALASEQIAGAAFHLEKLDNATPPDASSIRRRGHLHLRIGHVDRATADYGQWVALGMIDDPEGWLSYARLLLMRGDRQGYRNLCSQMLDVLEKDRHWSFVRNAARSLGLAPGSASEAGRLLRLIRKLLPDPELLRPHDMLAIALVHYRAAEWESARKSLQAMMNPRANEPQAQWPLMAMIQHHLGHAKEAGEMLADSKRRLDEHSARLGDRPGLAIDEGWFDFEILTREAEDLIGGPEK